MPAFERAIHLDGGFAQAYLDLALCLKECQRYDEAIESAEKACRIDSHSARYMNNAGVIYQEYGLFEQAVSDGVNDYDEIFLHGTDPLSSGIPGDLAPTDAPDGVLNTADLLWLMRFIGGLEDPDPQEFDRGSSRDGTLDVRDVLEMDVCSAIDGDRSAVRRSGGIRVWRCARRNVCEPHGEAAESRSRTKRQYRTW